MANLRLSVKQDDAVERLRAHHQGGASDDGISRTADRVKTILYPALSLIGFVALWHAAVILFELPVYILPRPLSIFPEIVESPQLFLRHTGVTLFETMAGLGMSIVVGIVFSFLIVWSDAMEKTLMPFIVLSQTFPKSAIAPLMIIWFGYDLLPKIIISFLISFFPIVINTVLGLKAPEADMVDLMRSMSATKSQIFLKVRVPTAVPYFFSGLKIGITLALVGAVVGEFVGADRGLGYLIMTANNQFNTTLSFATLFILMLLGAGLYFIAEILERRAAPWYQAVKRKGE